MQVLRFASGALCNKGATSAMVIDITERVLHTQRVKTERSVCNVNQCRDPSEVIGQLAEQHPHFEFKNVVVSASPS